MSKSTKTTMAVFALAFVAACGPRQEEFVMVEPEPQPIYVEPATTKY